MSGGPAWLHGGVALPQLSPSPAHVEITFINGLPIAAPCAAFREALARATPAELAAARIAIHAPTLLLCGDDDAVWPSAWFAADAASHSGAVDVHVFPAAGHRATMLPGDPTTDVALPHRSGLRIRPGGAPEADACAQRAGWQLAITFLRRELVR
jgi:pimeloyl-ACP methyl ester carboxylesterase